MRVVRFAAYASAIVMVYFASYFAMVIPTVAWKHPLYITGEYVPKYRMGGSVAEVIFAPANCLDRVIRPQIWTEVVEAGL